MRTFIINVLAFLLLGSMVYTAIELARLGVDQGDWSHLPTVAFVAMFVTMVATKNVPFGPRVANKSSAVETIMALARLTSYVEKHEKLYKLAGCYSKTDPSLRDYQRDLRRDVEILRDLNRDIAKKLSPADVTRLKEHLEKYGDKTQ